MMRAGLFLDEDGYFHQFYEVEEKSYYRLDICKEGTQYHIDPLGVEYSLFRKRDTFTYGDRSIYQFYLNLKETVSNAGREHFKNSYWSEGKFYSVTESVNDAKEFKSREVVINGAVSQFEATYGKLVFQYQVTYGASAKIDPLNIMDYQKQQIGLDVMDDASTSPYYPYVQLIKRYDLQHILERDLVVADTEEIAEQRLKEWCECGEEYLGFDTETTGLDVWLYGEDKLVGIILSCGENASTYFPFRMRYIHNLSREFLDKLMAACIERQDKLVAHNKKFDRQVMYAEGYDLRIRWCTLILSFMMNPVTIAGSHALKELMSEIDGKKYLELDEIFINKKDIDFGILDKEVVRLYACTDSTSAVTVLKTLMPQVPDSMWPIITIEMELADLKADQEYYGMRVDVKKYKSGYENCEYILNLLLTTFRKMTKEDGNINSQEVLSTLMYDKLGCQVLMRTKTGKRSTSSKAIKKLASVKSNVNHKFTQDIVDLKGNVIVKASVLSMVKYPALVILSKYKEYVKLKTAFYSRFERTMKTGRIHFWINQNGASSGRQSSPMHQLPPELKDVMISDSPRKDMWGPDYSQIELRMIAYLAGETELIDMCKEPTNDVHRVCASLITNKEMWEITKEERSIKKRVNFGVVYLISGYGLAGQLYGPGYSKEQVEYCQEQLDSFYGRFKRIDRYIKANAVAVNTNGYMKTKFGRIKYFKEIFDPDISRRKRATLIRQANNMPVQGTAADVMKIAEVNMYTWIREHGWNAPGEDGFPLVRLMLSIHDEVLISADVSIPMEEIIEMITTCMQIDLKGAPPFFVQPARMSNWGGHSDDSLAIPIRYRDKLIDDYRRTGKTAFKRSVFKLVADKEIISSINSETGSYRSIVDKYIDSVEYVKTSGDYVDTLCTSSKREALKSYLVSGSDVWTEDNYLLLLDEYRNSVLHDYMLGVIEKYGPDPVNVGTHVRHPTLTHELIALYEHQMKGTDMSHVEQINYAAGEYMKTLGDVEKTVTYEFKEEEHTNVEELFAEAENLYEFDKDGNIVFEEVDVDEEDDIITDEDADAILYTTSGEVFKVWKMVDRLVVDVDGLNMDDIDKVIAEVWKYKDSNGFYKVYLAMSGKLIDTKFKVEDVDISEISRFVSMLEKCG